MKTILILALLAFAAVGLDAEDSKLLYEINFEKAEIGKLPDGFLALEGEFVVKEDGTNKFLELPGAPLDNFSVQFGPAGNADVTVKARIYGTAKGRRYPTFGVGLGGVSGFRLQVSPGKKSLEIYKDADLKAGVAYEWKTGGWTALRLELHKIKDGEWKIEGKVWTAGTPEPSAPLIEVIEKEAPPTGRASVFGSPFSGTPIWFDDLVVEKAGR